MQASAHRFDHASVITAVSSVEEARALPRGSVVGDCRGGVTFSDAVARILEQRSACGWIDVTAEATARAWTVIYLNH